MHFSIIRFTPRLPLHWFLYFGSRLTSRSGLVTLWALLLPSIWVVEPAIAPHWELARGK